MSVGTQTASYHLCINLCSACLGVFVLFEHQTTCTFAQYKAIARLRVWTRCCLRRVVAGRQSVHRRETAYPCLAYGSFGSSCEYYVGFAQPYVVEGVYQSICRRGTSRGGSEVHSPEAVSDGNHSGCDIRYHLRYEERIEPRSHLFVQRIIGHLLFESDDTADTYAEYYSYFVQIQFARVQMSIVDSLSSHRNRILCKQIHLAGIFGVYVQTRVEPLHLASKLDLKLFRVKTCNRSCAALPPDNAVPEL